MNAINYNEMSVVYGQGGRVARRCMRDVSMSKGNSEGKGEGGGSERESTKSSWVVANPAYVGDQRAHVI